MKQIITIIEKIHCDHCHKEMWNHQQKTKEPKSYTLAHRVTGAQGMETDYTDIHLCGTCQERVYDFIKKL